MSPSNAPATGPKSCANKIEKEENMDKKEFDRLQQLSRNAWGELSRSGDEDKPSYLGSLFNSCPACQVATNGGKGDYTLCTKCPADLWRAIAVELSKEDDYHPGEAVCDMRCEWYHRWRVAGNIEERREIAKKIARMNWTYIPELHDPIKNKYRVVIEVKSDEVHILEAHSREEAENLALSAEPDSVCTTLKTVVQIDKLYELDSREAALDSK